ncbi:MAG: sodium:calcium antiporter [Minisyncoccia bacterium]
MEFFPVLIFILSALGIYFSGELVVNNIVRFSRFIGISSFIASFFLMGIASALPNLFVGVNSAFNKIPQLSLGDVFGNDFINLTLVISLAILFSKDKNIKIDNVFVRESVIFMIVAALAPLFFVADNNLSRYDGFFLLILFAFYIWWSFSRKNYNYEDVYSKSYQPFKKILLEWSFYKSFLKIIFGLVVLFFSAQGIIFSSKYFALKLNLPMVVIGMLIVGFGNALPETYFAVSSARKNETQLIFGNMVGSVIAPATLVLGIVSLIHPISIENFSFLEINRLFYILVTILLLWFFERKKELTKTNALILILIYFSFLILIRNFIG